MKKGYKVLTLESETLDQLKTSIVELGRELGKGPEAERIVSAMSAKLAALKGKAQKVNPTRGLFVVGRQPLVVAGSGNLFNDVAPYLGLINVAEESRFLYPTYSLEMFLGKAPDMILDFSMGSEASAASQEEARKWWSQFSKVPPFKTENYF
jgi:ABC-type Fe3+-hydroxamate transport system substrate-binding protein